MLSFFSKREKSHNSSQRFFKVKEFFKSLSTTSIFKALQKMTRHSYLTWPNSLSLWLTTFLIYLSQTVLFCLNVKTHFSRQVFFDKYEADNWRTKIFDKISHLGHWGHQDCKAKASENSNFVISKRYYCLILCIKFI